MVYVAFVLDAYSRRILGWRAATSMQTALVLDALEHGDLDPRPRRRHRPGRADSSHRRRVAIHLDRVHRAARRRRHRPLGRVVGDAYDNALAESMIGLFKTELINRAGRGATVEQVEIATLEWVDWFNHRAPHELDRRPHPRRRRGPPLRSPNAPGNRRVTQETESPDAPGGLIPPGPPPQKRWKCNDVPRHLSTVSRDITLVAGAGLRPATSGL